MPRTKLPSHMLTDKQRKTRARNERYRQRQIANSNVVSINSTKESKSQSHSTGMNETESANKIVSNTQASNEIVSQSHSTGMNETESANEIVSNTQTSSEIVSQSHTADMNETESVNEIVSNTQASNEIVSQSHTADMNETESVNEIVSNTQASNEIVSQSHSTGMNETESANEITGYCAGALIEPMLSANEIISNTQTSSEIVSQSHTADMNKTESANEIVSNTQTSSEIVSQSHTADMNKTESANETSKRERLRWLAIVPIGMIVIAVTILLTLTQYQVYESEKVPFAFPMAILSEIALLALVAIPFYGFPRIVAFLIFIGLFIYSLGVLSYDLKRDSLVAVSRIQDLSGSSVQLSRSLELAQSALDQAIRKGESGNIKTHGNNVSDLQKLYQKEQEKRTQLVAPTKDLVENKFSGLTAFRALMMLFNVLMVHTLIKHFRGKNS